MKLYSFTSNNYYDIKGRGRLYLINEPWHGKGADFDPNILKGHEVLINNETYNVKGAETYAVGRSEDRPYRLKFGLLADKLPNH